MKRLRRARGDDAAPAEKKAEKRQKEDRGPARTAGKGARPVEPEGSPVRVGAEPHPAARSSGGSAPASSSAGQKKKKKKKEKEEEQVMNKT